MSFYDAIRVGAAGASTGYEVERSLRFNKSDSMYLERTPSSTGNQKVWTWSAWFKRTALHDVGGTVYLFSCNNVSGNDGIAGIYMQNDEIYTYFDTSGSNPYGSVNSRKFRDTGAWMHIVWQVDAANTTQRIWINGEELSLNSGNNPPDFSYGMNQSGIKMFVGRDGDWGSAHSNFYFAEIHYSDGNKYEASDFAETDATTGQWIPKEVNISYGTNGYYLNFSDNSGTTATTLGKDLSGNGNNFTPINFSVSAGVNNDSVEDTPTNNFCTLNPLDTWRDNSSTSDGNLKFTRSASNFGGGRATMAVKTGKWYFEFTKGSGLVQAGFVNTDFNINYNSGDVSLTSSGANACGLAYDSRGFWYGYTGSNPSSISDDDIIGVAFDADNFKFYFHKNGTYYGSGNPSTGSNGITPNHSNQVSKTDDMFFAPYFNAENGNGYANFGQRPFSYTIPTGYKALNSQNLPDPTILLPNQHFNTVLYSGDGNATKSITGVGFKPDWLWLKGRNTSYSHLLYNAVVGAGTGKGLNSNEARAEGSVVADNSTYGFLNSFDSDGFSVTKGSDSTSYTNGGSSNYVSWNWNAGETDGATYRVVVVSDSGNKYRFRNSANTATFAQSAVTLDLAEGGTYIFNMDDSTNASHPFSIGTAANGTVYTTGITYFLDGVSKTYSEYTSGFAAATTRRLHITVPASAPQLYYWCSVHSGMGGAINTNTTLGSSNFDGTVQSTAKVNTSAGFSIATLNGTGSVLTFGHGLGVKPDAVILKARNIANNWLVFHQGYGATKTTFLDNESAESDNAQWYNDTEPTSTVFTLGTWSGMNTSTPSTIVAFCFNSVEQYSKFGSYVGNSNDNGTFVFTGFSVAWLMVKRSNGSNTNWTILDNKRDTSNVAETRLFANSGSADSVSSGGVGSVDFLSNGFKVRDSHQDGNSSSGTYIYFAFAKSPFKNSRAR